MNTFILIVALLFVNEGIINKPSIDNVQEFISLDFTFSEIHTDAKRIKKLKKKRKENRERNKRWEKLLLEHLSKAKNTNSSKK